MGLPKMKTRGRSRKSRARTLNPVTHAEAAVRSAELIAKELRDINASDPRSAVWEEAAREAFEVYEMRCAKLGMCRHFDCFARARLRLCKTHRHPVAPEAC